MVTLSYAGDVEVISEPTDSIQGVIADLIDLQTEPNAVTVDVSQVRPIGAGWIVSISLSASGELPKAVQLRQQVAQAAVDIGLEPDIASAEEDITVS